VRKSGSLPFLLFSIPLILAKNGNSLRGLAKPVEEFKIVENLGKNGLFGGYTVSSVDPVVEGSSPFALAGV